MTMGAADVVMPMMSRRRRWPRPRARARRGCRLRGRVRLQTKNNCVNEKKNDDEDGEITHHDARQS